MHVKVYAKVELSAEIEAARKLTPARRETTAIKSDRKQACANVVLARATTFASRHR